MKNFKFLCFGIFALTSVFSLNGFANTRHFQLKATDGHQVNVDLIGFDSKDAVIAPTGNFCSQSQTVTAWHPNIDVQLIVDGKLYRIDSDNSSGWSNIGDLGISYIYYFETFTYKDESVCLSDAKQASFSIPLNYQGPIDEKNLKMMRLSFSDKAYNVATSLADLALRLDFEKHQVTLLRSKKNVPDGQYTPNGWEVAAQGSF